MRRDLYHRAEKLWGMDDELRMLQEEAAEVIVAVSHTLRRGSGGSYVPDDILAMAEEMADLEIMLEQARAMGFGLHIDYFKTIKLGRLQKRIEKAENPEDPE